MKNEKKGYTRYKQLEGALKMRDRQGRVQGVARDATSCRELELVEEDQCRWGPALPLSCVADFRLSLAQCSSIPAPAVASAAEDEGESDKRDSPSGCESDPAVDAGGGAVTSCSDA